MKPTMIFLCAWITLFITPCQAEEPALRNLDSGFPMTPVADAGEWETRRAEIVRRIRLSAGLSAPRPKTALNAVRGRKVERDGFTVEPVYFESLPGHLVTGSLWLPAGAGEAGAKPMPGVLCPHGHFNDGRFFVQGDGNIERQMGNGAESDENAARYPLQARCAQLARMGCAVLFYDMEGYADSIQLPGHRPGLREGFDGLFSARADAHGMTVFGLQTWNSVRALDFLLTVPAVDPERIAVTGASGGATQTMMIAAIDDRVSAAFPCVMVSEAMQGGCPCENAHHLRIGQGNVDIAAAVAPRPLGLTAADDWTIDLETKGYPDLQKIYRMLGAEDNLTAGFYTQFKHNYNAVSRSLMYGFMNRHLGLGIPDDDPGREERPFVALGREELSAWGEKDGAGKIGALGFTVGEEHELELMETWARLGEDAVRPLFDPGSDDHEAVREEVRAAYALMVGDAGIGRGDVEGKDPTNEVEEGIAVGRITLAHPSFGEELGAALALPTSGFNKKFVLWLTPEGSRAIIADDGDLTLQAVTLVASGFGVAAVDLPGADLGANPHHEVSADAASWKHYAGFTYGYNDTLFVRRVRAVLGLLAHAGAGEDPEAEFILVGLGGMAPVAAAVRALRPEVVTRLAIDTGGFRYGKLEDPWGREFLPCAAGLGDLPGLLALGAPRQTWVAGEGEGIGQLRALYKDLGEADRLRFYQDEDWIEQSAAEWITHGD